MVDTKKEGYDAESRALSFLQSQGLLLVERNWFCKFGEIDLIMYDRTTLVFVEVRYRKSMQFGGALESITPAKCQKLQKTALFYLQKNHIEESCRFDAVLYEGKHQVHWLKNILT